MNPPAIEARGLTKVYSVYERPLDRLLETLLRRPRHREFKALENVSFEVPMGEGLGIIGENGAGKSTLLKMLAGIVSPTRGSLVVHGRVASILELGAGFHPELSGRANILLNAALHGLRKTDVQGRMERIIEWSELGEFIDQPVKCYSTGMAMRLGFSIATEVDPDILIIDEALAVGDGYFQKKCMDRLLALIAQGKTILFCSHAMYYVTAFCRRALWLRHGEVAALGPADEVVRAYESFLQARTASEEAHSAQAAAAGQASPASSAKTAWISAVELPSGASCRHREPWQVEVRWQAQSPSQRFHLGVGINRIDEVEVMAFGTHLDGLPVATGSQDYHMRLEIPQLPLLKGTFTLYVFLLDEQGLHIYDRRILPGAFEIAVEGYRFGLIDTPHAWTLKTVDSSQPAMNAGAASVA